MFYNGNPKVEPGAVVCRLSPSFIRFGTFELPSIRGGKDMALVQQIADFVIRHYYSDIVEEKDYKGFLREVGIRFSSPTSGAVSRDYICLDAIVISNNQVIRRSAALCAQWHQVGFVHGVLNTDNCSILGLTIDYGPFGFMDFFDPSYTPNITDFGGRRYW